MALPSSSAAFAVVSPLGFLPITEKLTRNNYPMWKAQVMSALRGAEVVHFIDPVVQPPTCHLPPKEDKKVDEAPVENPELSKWVAKDQQVLSYLLTSLSCEIGSQVSSATTAAAAVDLEFNPVVTAVGARVEPISIN
jgi:hypothetical protein